jgi:hypothetical protein
VKVQEQFRHNRNDLFKTWLDCGEGVAKISTAALERLIKKSTQAKTVQGLRNRRELIVAVGGTLDDSKFVPAHRAASVKVDKVIAACIQFPDDP